MICGHVKWFTLLADLHHLNGFVLSNFENVEQRGLRFTILHKLNNFVDASVVGSDVENFILLIQYFYVNPGKKERKKSSWKRENAIIENSCSLKLFSISLFISINIECGRTLNTMAGVKVISDEIICKCKKASNSFFSLCPIHSGIYVTFRRIDKINAHF